MAVDKKKLNKFIERTAGDNPFAGGKKGKNGGKKKPEEDGKKKPGAGGGEHDDDDEGTEGGEEHEKLSQEDVDLIAKMIDDGDGDEELIALAGEINDENDPPEAVTDHALWEEAKKSVESKWDDYENPYAVALHVYEKMGGKFADDEEEEDEEEEDGRQ